MCCAGERPQGGGAFAEAADRTASTGTEVRPGALSRTVVHALSTTELKQWPKRVAVLDGGVLGHVVSLGGEPVGHAPTEGDWA
ncbi:hypothetical protein [Streptomyces sp. CC224B]|uniref:hypothetical protein n=1 Tax=Streptomyces sp. CC224B TaxID=3044571 RepID=UPI0024A807E4|nr:hypothetical protein [Streptomyces sp. CC224B]